ncbi:MAG TPA: hypothetical protein VGO93_27820 [Candidatus Xenobia bacterium]
MRRRGMQSTVRHSNVVQPPPDGVRAGRARAPGPIRFCGGISMCGGLGGTTYEAWRVEN